MVAPVPDSELIRRAQAGDISARDALLDRHERFIWLMVRRALGPGVRQVYAEEYFSIGVMVMIRAIAAFDPARATSILTYAGIGIVRDVQQALNRAPVLSRPANRPRDAASRELWKRAASRASLIPDWQEHSIESNESMDAEHADALASLRTAMRRLPEHVRHVLSERAVGRTMVQIGRELGVCRERVRQIELQGIETLRAYMGVEACSRPFAGKRKRPSVAAVSMMGRRVVRSG